MSPARAASDVAAGAVLAAVLGLTVAVPPAAAQVYPQTDQSIAPAYEGWEQNDDGTFNLVFGYMNRNWDQELDVPIGAGQPARAGRPGSRPADALPAAAQPARLPRAGAGRLR